MIYKVEDETITQRGTLLYYKGRLIQCPKCKDSKIYDAKDGKIKICLEC